MPTRSLREGLALTAALAASTGTAVGMTHLARGDIRGAPGMTHALSRIGKIAGGGMMTGMALTASSSTLVGLVLYRALRKRST